MRARLKAPEDMPPENLCCDASKACAAKNAGKVLEIHGPVFTAPWTCGGGCAEGVATNYCVIGQDFQYVGMESIDIEEGA
jgi:hypothetical protein